MYKVSNTNINYFTDRRSKWKEFGQVCNITSNQKETTSLYYESTSWNVLWVTSIHNAKSCLECLSQSSFCSVAFYEGLSNNFRRPLTQTVPLNFLLSKLQVLFPSIGFLSLCLPWSPLAFPPPKEKKKEGRQNDWECSLPNRPLLELEKHFSNYTDHELKYHFMGHAQVIYWYSSLPHGRHLETKNFCRLYECDSLLLAHVHSHCFATVSTWR